MSLNKKKICALVLSLTMTASMLVSGASAEAATETSKETVYTPGDYTETVAGHNGDFEVTVTFSENAIEDITIGENNESNFVGTHAMDTVKADILENQTVNVDTIAGATISSGGLLRAVTDAVKEAGGDPDSMPDAHAAADIREDATCDVVIVGAGGAGLCATMEAVQNGLNVILVEQEGQIGGSSARAGYLLGADTVVEEENGVTYTTEELTDLLVSYNPDQAELAQYMAENCGPTIDWLYGMGLTDIYYDEGSIYGSGLHWGNYGRIGGYFCYTMQNQLDENEVDYRLNTRATALVMDGEKVVGVEVQPTDGDAYTIYADSVILTTGGFAANSEMVDEYTPELSGYGYDCAKGSDGSGMLMAAEAGAALDNMSDVFSYYGLNVVYNYVPRNLTYPYLLNGQIIVNEEGNRFCNELMYYDASTVTAMSEQTNRHGFIIMNQDMADNVIQPALDYSADQACMYTKCETLDEVAELFGIDADQLKATVEQYDGYVAAGEDPDFSKPDYAMPEAIGDGPYYVAEVTSCSHMTYGGIRTDNAMHALTEDNTVIEGLYAAGECTHVMMNGIGTNTISMVEGRLAVDTILSEKAA